MKEEYSLIDDLIFLVVKCKECNEKNNVKEIEDLIPYFKFECIKCKKNQEFHFEKFQSEKVRMYLKNREIIRYLKNRNNQLRKSIET